MHLGNFSTETNVQVKKWHTVSFYMAFYKMGQSTMGSRLRFAVVSAPGNALGDWDPYPVCGGGYQIYACFKTQV